MTIHLVVSRVCGGGEGVDRVSVVVDKKRELPHPYTCPTTDPKLMTH